jgi:hypothetical protein
MDDEKKPLLNSAAGGIQAEAPPIAPPIQPPPYEEPSVPSPYAPPSVANSGMPPPYAPPTQMPGSGQSLFVQCRVCQHVIHVAPGTQSRVVKCSNCREATVSDQVLRQGSTKALFCVFLSPYIYNSSPLPLLRRARSMSDVLATAS